VRGWIASAVVLIAASLVSVGSSSCSGECDSAPPADCYPPPGATHEQACAACAAGYTGCRDGEWVTISCGSPTTSRDGGR
jgi:hypothetical protein